MTKRAVAHENAVVEWVDGNLGSKVTMKYPAVVLAGPKAHGEVLSLAMAGDGQHQDTGAKMTHAAPETSSVIVSKSISRGGGRTSYRGLVKVLPGATGVKSNVRCDALLVDPDSRSDTYPYIDVKELGAQIGHEATVARIGEEQLRGSHFSALVITHYMWILSFLRPDLVHVLHQGRVVRSGGPELAEELEQTGYAEFRAMDQAEASPPRPDAMTRPPRALHGQRTPRDLPAGRGGHLLLQPPGQRR